MSTLIEKIQNKLPDIVSLTGIEKQGTHPVHGSETGMNFSTHKFGNKWYCFRCKVGGYALHWIAIQNGVLDCNQALDKNNFKIVLEEAARYVGLDDELHRSINKINEEAYFKQTRFYSSLGSAQKYFTSNIDDEHFQYIKQKWGFSKEQAQRLGIGFCPKNQIGLSQYLATEGFSRREILRTGLIYLFEKNNNLSDIFQGMITIPYLDANNNPLFFIARDPEFEHKLLKKEKYAVKYKKQLVHVSKHPYIERDILEPIFGQAQLENKLISQVPFIVIAEGITDAQTLQIWDIPVLSPVTTGFSKDQIENVVEFSKKFDCPIYICFDNETNLSGLKGALRTIDEFPDDMDVFYIELPLPDGADKIDLNEFFKNGATKEDFAMLIDVALPRDVTKKLWRYFKNPYCIDRLISRARVPTNNRIDAFYLLGKELFHTMNKSWDQTIKIIKNSSKTKILNETLTILEQKIVYNIPVEEKIHSCKKILDYPFMRNLCKMDQCLHISDDFPEGARIGFNNEDIYTKLFEISFIRHPKEYMEKYYTYELKFPKEIFNNGHEYVSEQDGSIYLTDKELVKPFEFEIQFRALFDVQFKVPGEKKRERDQNWDELVQHWFQNKIILYRGEQVYYTPKIIEEQFLLFIDRHMKRYLSFELDDTDSYPIEDSIYYIAEDQKIYVPIPLVIKYQKEHIPNINLSKLRGYLKNWLISNSFTKKIRGYEIRLWPFSYTPDQFPQITQYYKDEQERIKAIKEFEGIK